MCLAKGITGGHLPLGATIMTKDVAKSFEFNFSFYSTFGWHPLCVRAAIANIKYFMKNKKSLLLNVSKTSSYIEKRIKTMQFAYPADIRIKGLIIGVKFENKKYALKVMDKCLENGLILAPNGTDFMLFPSLNIDQKTLTKAMDILEKSL